MIKLFQYNNARLASGKGSRGLKIGTSNVLDA
jgi:hypothetical protein